MVFRELREIVDAQDVRRGREPRRRPSRQERRARAPVEGHGLGADGEWELARELYVMQLLGT
jgi:hypothetical protein